MVTAFSTSLCQTTADVLGPGFQTELHGTLEFLHGTLELLRTCEPGAGGGGQECPSVLFLPEHFTLLPNALQCNIVCEG